MGVPETDPLSQLSLPPGFRFYPTDEELLVQYLCRKVAGQQFSLQIIGEIDLYKFDPWVLPSKAMFGEKEWYFFSPRDRKYPNGSRPNRVAGSGYWKATGTDKVITTEGRKVGIKKALVFYVGKAPKGTKTNWIMHEYRLIEPSRKHGSSKLDEWVLCRIYKKNSSGQKPILSMNSQEQSTSSSSPHLDDVLESLPEIDHQFFNFPRINSLKTLQNDDKINLQNLASGNFDWATLAGLSSVAELGGGGVQTTQGQNQGTVTTTHANNNVYNNNDMYVPSMSSVCHASNQQVPKLEEEVQSGVRGSGADPNSFFFHQNSTGFPQNLSNSSDPFGYRYPTQQPGFGLFRR